MCSRSTQYDIQDTRIGRALEEMIKLSTEGKTVLFVSDTYWLKEIKTILLFLHPEINALPDNVYIYYTGTINNKEVQSIVDNQGIDVVISHTASPLVLKNVDVKEYYLIIEEESK